MVRGTGFRGDQPFALHLPALVARPSVDTLCSVSESKQHLRAWQNAGLLDEETVSRIVAFESASRPAPSALPEERPGVIEAILYLGFVVAGAGIFFLVGNNWEQLTSWSRLMLVATAALLALGAGAGMHLAAHPGVRRGGQAAWLLAVALSAASLAVAFNEYGGHQLSDERWQIVVVATATFALAMTLWAFAPSSLQVLAIAGATVFFAEALGAWPDEYSPRLAGLTIATTGAALLVLTELGVFRPVRTARVAAAALCGIGAFHAGVDSSLPWEFIAFVAGGALIGLGIWRASFTYVAVAVATLLVALITFMFEHFGGELGAPIALILSGGLLIGSVLVLVQVRTMIHRHRVAV